MLAGKPLLVGRSDALGGAGSPTKRRRVGADGLEHRNSRSLGLRDERINLGQRNGLVSKKDHRSSAFLCGLKDSVRIGKKRIGVLIAKAHLSSSETQIRCCGVIARVRCEGTHSSPFNALQNRTRILTMYHDQGMRLVKTMVFAKRRRDSPTGLGCEIGVLGNLCVLGKIAGSCRIGRLKRSIDFAGNAIHAINHVRFRKGLRLRRIR